MREAENGGSTWSVAVQGVLRELHAVAHAAADPTLDSALLAAREAMNSWRAQIEQLALHERARDDAREHEEHARQRVCLILDLVTQLAALPRGVTSGAVDSAARRPRGAQPMGRASTTGSDGLAAPAVRGLAAYLLGSFELQVDGRRVTDWRGRRGPAVLQFLVIRRGQFVDREVLSEALWPGISPDLGRHRLHQAIYALRQTLHQLDPDMEHIVCENGAYRLVPGVRLWTDVAEFERLAAAGAEHESAGRTDAALDAYRRAELLYRGDFVEGSLFADWAAAERGRLRASYVVVGSRLGKLHAERGDHMAALAVCSRVLKRDPWNEEVTRRAMLSYAATGNRSLALQLFKSFEAELASELGVAPSAEARTLFTEILAPTTPATRPSAR